MSPKFFIDVAWVEAFAKEAANSDRKVLENLRELAGKYQGFLNEMLSTGKTKNQSQFVKSLATLQNTIDAINVRIEKEPAEEARPIIFWTEQMTEDFLDRYIGPCTLDFPS